MAEKNTKEISAMLFLARDMGEIQVTDIKAAAERNETRKASLSFEADHVGGIPGTGFMTPDGRYPIIKSRPETELSLGSTVEGELSGDKKRVEHASLVEDRPKGGLLDRLKPGGNDGNDSRSDGGFGSGTPSKPDNDSENGRDRNKTSVIKRAVVCVVTLSAVALAGYSGWVYLFAGTTSSRVEPISDGANKSPVDEEPDTKSGQGSLGMDVPAVNSSEPRPRTEKAFGTPPPVDTGESDIGIQTERNESKEAQTLGMEPVEQATTLDGHDVPTLKPSESESVNLSHGVASDIDLSVEQLGTPSADSPEKEVTVTADAERDTGTFAASADGAATSSDVSVAPSGNAGSTPEPVQSRPVSDQPAASKDKQLADGGSSTDMPNQLSRQQDFEAVSASKPESNAATGVAQAADGGWNSEEADYLSSPISSITHSGRLLSQNYNASITVDSRPQPSVDAGALKATIGQLRGELTQVRRERNRIEEELDAKPDSLSYPGWHVMGTTGRDSAVLVGPSDQTRIVRTGDALWGSTVTEIDPNRQIVRTHDGIIRAGP